MGEATALELVRGLYDYHWWANRRLFDHAAMLGEEAAGRDVGRYFSFPTVRRMLAHLYGADWIWLARWKGSSPSALPGDDIRTLADLRPRWDQTEGEQRAFIEALAPVDLGRVVCLHALSLPSGVRSALALVAVPADPALLQRRAVAQALVFHSPVQVEAARLSGVESRAITR